MIKQPPNINQRTPRGVGDPNGTRSLLGSRRYQAWRKRIAIDRLNSCAVCWERDGIITPFDELHHIKPRSTHPELVMDEHNVELLCANCHDEKHALTSRLEPPVDTPGRVFF